jgi:transposase
VAIFTTDQRKEQRVYIKFCANLGKSATEILTMIQQAFGDPILSRAQVFQWHARYKTGRKSVEDNEHTGRPTSCTTPENFARIQELVRQDRRRTIHCWGGGNWLWDMPTGSDERIGHAPCRSQICAHHVLHQDNASSHTSVFTQQFLAKYKSLSSPPTLLP